MPQPAPPPAAAPVPFPVIPQPVGDLPPNDPVPVAPRVLRPRPPAPAPIIRPRRAGAGTNRNLPPDNAYGDRTPVEIERDIQENDESVNIEVIQNLLLQSTNHDPRSLQEALSLPDRSEWEAAMRDELKSHEDNKTWTLVDLPPNRKAVKSKWVYTYKADGRHKARLVAKGFTQVQGIDYEETFSPVARFESIRFLLAHAALEDWDIEALDVKTAFLYGVLDEEIYMEQPEGFVEPGQEGKVCRLWKAIYGLKQASRTWNHKIHKTLEDLGFTRTNSDAGVYVYRQRVGDSDLVIILYVDDLLPMGSDPAQIKFIKEKLQEEYQMRDLGPVQNFLGMRITRDRDARTIAVDQESYIEEALGTFQMLDASPARTPLAAGTVLVKADPKLPIDFALRTKYQSLIGTLLYITLGTRPDISYAVTRLSQYSAHPTSEHLKAAMHILRYLNGTRSLQIVYRGASRSGLIGYSDSDWAENKDDRHSTTGYVHFMADAAVSWVSRRQKTVALSSTEAEYMALSDSSRQVAWLRMFQRELGFDTSHPTPMCADNNGSIFLAINPAHDRRTKHVDIRYHYIREFLEAGHAKLYYVNTNEQIADILTKPLTFEKHADFRGRMGLSSPTS